LSTQRTRKARARGRRIPAGGQNRRVACGTYNHKIRTEAFSNKQNRGSPPLPTRRGYTLYCVRHGFLGRNDCFFFHRFRIPGGAFGPFAPSGKDGSEVRLGVRGRTCCAPRTDLYPLIQRSDGRAGVVWRAETPHLISRRGCDGSKSAQPKLRHVSRKRGEVGRTARRAET